MKNTLNEEVSRIKSIMGLMNEEMNSQAFEEFQNALDSAGIERLDNEELSELQPDCPVEVPQEHPEVMEDLKNAVERITDRRTLLSLLKEVMTLRRNAKKQAPVQEQAAPIVLAGVTIPPVAITIALGFLALLIVISLAKSIFGGGGRRNNDCKRKNRLFKRFGLSGVVYE